MSYLAVLISLDVGIVDVLASGDGVFSGMFECPLWDLILELMP